MDSTAKLSDVQAYLLSRVIHVAVGGARSSVKPGIPFERTYGSARAWRLALWVRTLIAF